MKPGNDLMLTLIENVCTFAEQSLRDFATNELDGNLETLTPSLANDVFAGLHKSLIEAGRKAFEAFIQSYGKDLPATVTFEGVEWRRGCTERKEFLTKFGEISLERGLYYAQDSQREHAPKSEALGKAFVPLDCLWEMEGRNATVDMVEELLYLSASQATKEATRSFNRISGLNVTSTRVYQIIQKDGKRFKEYADTHRQERWRLLEPPERAEAFSVSLDGGNLALREAGKKRGRSSSRPEHEENEPKDGKKSSYKNAMVGSYSFYATEEVCDHTGEISMRPERLCSAYTAKMPEERYTSFKEENREVLKFIHEKILTAKAMTKLLIMDGAPALWHYARESGLFEEYDWILDFYHASEHLSTLSKALFGEDTDLAKAWYKKWRRKLKKEEGAVTGLLRSINYYGKKNCLRGERKKTWEKEKGFFTRNQEIMNYAIYYAEGLPIGSGPVEAACKTIVKSRMCQSGMRWNRESGANVLNLRVIKQSDQWDDMWSLYRREAWNLRKAA